ncbi:hypothetical protein [Enterobacter roggenkampii]|uniref:hypothetical protein n=1 Tax=Enterobacter roggenkampii TaxID=1812935 RepID=UPI00064A4861|nr:hypothetical protein [Enterobacter roggenkampii]KLP29066.1 hypothetical protein YA48_18295 [Enterobacter roggenkampii]MDL0001920.1 hypothetical protein [Enterobacter roggenkampii]MDU7043518.1 hypothetical protein [Enterobacter roggenkampii]TXU39464.1 hypothetical protein D4M93_19290 [Enterobacter roggenkampii]TXU91532.1 hypothetical protein D4M95_07700 [Enterobacter roggenkampii]
MTYITRESNETSTIKCEGKMKRNIRVIPKNVYSKLKRLGNTVVAGTSIAITESQLKNGMLEHLGIYYDNGVNAYEASVIPDPLQGKYSLKNVFGEEIVRRDLPKETHYTEIESPNWGDSSNGTHTVRLPHEKYPRDIIPPKLIAIENNHKQSSGSHFIFNFRVTRILEKKSSTFDDDLLFDLNLLQENLGKCGVENADKPISTYADTLIVSWDIFPPGSKEEVLSRIFRGKNITPDKKNVAENRYDFFMSLEPKKIVTGNSTFSNYLGAMLEDDLVVFENIEYGNAIYILYDNWDEISKLSRIDLLSGRAGNNFDRIIHSGNWKDEVRKKVATGRL